MSEADMLRDFGRLEAQVEELLDWRDEMREWCKKQDEKTDAMLATANQVKGGWKVLLGAASAAGAITGFFASALSKMKDMP